MPCALRLAAADDRRRARRRASRSRARRPAWTTSPAGLSTTARCSSSYASGGRSGAGTASGADVGGDGDRSRRPRAGSSSAAAARRRAPRPQRPARPPRASRRARRGTGRAAPPAAARWTADRTWAARSSESPAETVAMRPRTPLSGRRRGGASGAAAAVGATSVTSRIATPSTMKVSARLNAGHQPRSRKSVTCPRRTRSTRFETLPPISRPSAPGSPGAARPSGRRRRASTRRRRPSARSRPPSPTRRARTRCPSSGRGGSRPARRR